MTNDGTKAGWQSRGIRLRGTLLLLMFLAVTWPVTRAGANLQPADAEPKDVDEGSVF